MPYLDTISGILNDVKGWFFALVGVVTLVVVIKNAFAYQAGDIRLYISGEIGRASCRERV